MSVAMTDPVGGASAGPLSETWLRAWETSADLAYCRDLKGRIISANLSFARKFGRAATALADTPVVDLLHPDDAGMLNATETDLLRPPHHADGEHRWMTPQGVRWFAWDETGLANETGTIVAIRAVGRDITRQRLAEEQFYRLSRAVEQSPVSIVITDLDGRAQYVNAKFTEVTGHTLEDILDKNIEVLRDGHPDQPSFENFWKAVQAGGEWRGELGTQRPDGAVVWESVKVSCLRGPTGEITNYLCLREDITERKQLEQQLRQAQKMESLGTLAGGIAHDFNNLLAIINGYSEFCQQGTQEPAVLQKSLREIHRAALRASGLVRQILTFSRKTEVKFSPVDLNQLTRDLVTLMAETFPRTVTIQLDLQDRLPALLADHNQLQQIILNLCVNARDAMPAGGPITLTTRTVAGANVRRLGADPGHHYACLRVSDTGIGMTPEIRQRIFEPFFTTKGGNQGTGLGLAVVYGIVVAHHGFIDVVSVPGVGSTFSVYLPLAESSAAAQTGSGSSDFPGGTESLLIVDDEESLRALLAAALARKGYTTMTARSGVDAIEMISDGSRQFDAVLLDLNMPGASGVEVLKVIRICRPRLKVVVVSGHINPAARVEFEQLGQRYFVQKPYKLDELGRQLRSLLDSPINNPESAQG
jgi:two-component system, cell cycle sensor histidine kinase and response regulator CckA